MLAEWSVECSHRGPRPRRPLEEPRWLRGLRRSPRQSLRLRRYPRGGAVSAADAGPARAQCDPLPVFTAKCDAWPLDGEELEHLQLNLDIPPAEAPAGFASYIDLVCRERSLFTSFPRHEQLLRRLTRLAAPLDHPCAALDCVLRPALIDLDGPREGFAFSLYVKALGADRQAAFEEWAAALEAIVALVRAPRTSPG